MKPFGSGSNRFKYE
jgi:hypothetical protein